MSPDEQDQDSPGDADRPRRYFEAAWRNASVALFITDERQRCTYMNPAAVQVTGYTLDELEGRSLHEVAHHSRPDGSPYPKDECPIVLALSGRGRVQGEETFVHKHGHYYPVAFTVSPVHEGDTIAGSVVEVRDISEQRRAEARLLERELRYRLVADASNDAIWDWNLQSDRVVWNEGVRTRFGYAADSIGVDASWWVEHIHPDDRPAVVGSIHDNIDHGPDEWQAEYRFQRADGSYATVYDRGRVVRDAEGTAIRMVGAMLDLTERRRAEEALRMAEERFAFVRQSSGVGFWYCDLPFDVLRWDALVKAHFHLPPDAVVTIETFYERLHPDDREPTRRAIERSIAEHSSYDVNYRTVDPGSGSEKWVRAIGRTAYAPDGSPSRFDGVTIDVTDQKRAEEERERLLAEAEAARAEAEAASRMKDEFLAILSHELRTPLNAIVGWARILNTGPVDPEDLEEGLAAIDRNAKIQAQLVEDLLDVSRIISGNLRLDVQRVNLGEVIEAAIDAVIPAAEAKGVRVKKVLDSLAGPVSGDPARLQQVIWNLLSNAVKFTPKGGRVQVLLERVNSHVEISVIDTGMGIKPEFLPRVFERFLQADSTTTRRYGGLGLGLSIVKQLVELHGGTVRAKSPGEGQGATFVLSLPIPVVHEGQAQPEKVRPKEPGEGEFDCHSNPLSGIKVLAVDDEPDARHLIRRVLSECGAEVILAESADEAVRHVEQAHPDVIVSDIGMPGRDGYDLIRQVRERFGAKVLPAVALTAFARSEDRKRALLAGFQTHVAKPVDPAELVAVVASLAGRTGV